MQLEFCARLILNHPALFQLIIDRDARCLHDHTDLPLLAGYVTKLKSSFPVLPRLGQEGF